MTPEFSLWGRERTSLSVQAYLNCSAVMEKVVECNYPMVDRKLQIPMKELKALCKRYRVTVGNFWEFYNNIEGEEDFCEKETLDFAKWVCKEYNLDVRPVDLVEDFYIEVVYSQMEEEDNEIEWHGQQTRLVENTIDKSVDHNSI